MAVCDQCGAVNRGYYTDQAGRFRFIDCDHLIPVEARKGEGNTLASREIGAPEAAEEFNFLKTEAFWR